jgi:hypothetical protein
MPIYDLYSQRDVPLPDVFQRHELPEGFRTQVLWIWRDVFLERHKDCLNELWAIVCRENGVDHLYPTSRDSVDDLVNTLKFGKNITLVLQIIELSFRTMFGMEKRLGSSFAKHYTDELNHRFREHGIGYQFDRSTQRLVPINAALVHEQAVRPALFLLAQPDFATANKEFMEAWDDFKKSDFDDCLTKCCSCFESVMKIICTKKGWAFPDGTASTACTQILSLPPTRFAVYFPHWRKGFCQPHPNWCSA